MEVFKRKLQSHTDFRLTRRLVAAAFSIVIVILDLDWRCGLFKYGLRAKGHAQLERCTTD